MFGVYAFGQSYFAQGPGDTPTPPATGATDTSVIVLGDPGESAAGVVGLGDGGLG